MIDISVIVPVFNVENYLEKCIKSIINQAYKNIEIILIDDGSTDKSGIICDKFAQKYSNIKVIHKKNGGLSSARNKGIEIAKGRYLSFIDSDDWIEQNFYNELINSADKYEAEIVIANKVEYIEKNGKYIKSNDNDILIFNSEQIIEKYIEGKWIAAWDKIYKKELFNDCKFPVGVLNEDEAIMVKIFNKANKIIYNPKAIYFYRKRVSGSITSDNSNLQNYFDWINHSLENYKFIKINYPSLYKKAFARHLNSLIWTMHYISYRNDNKYNKEKLWIKRKLIDNIFIILFSKQISKTSKISTVCMILNDKLYSSIRKKLRKVR